MDTVFFFLAESFTVSLLSSMVISQSALPTSSPPFCRLRTSWSIPRNYGGNNKWTFVMEFFSKELWLICLVWDWPAIPPGTKPHESLTLLSSQSSLCVERLWKQKEAQPEKWNDGQLSRVTKQQAEVPNFSWRRMNDGNEIPFSCFGFWLLALCMSSLVEHLTRAAPSLTLLITRAFFY